MVSSEGCSSHAPLFDSAGSHSIDRLTDVEAMRNWPVLEIEGWFDLMIIHIETIRLQRLP